jgi:hypothetical protein
MAQVTFNIRDAKITEAIDAVAALHNYQALLTDGTVNPETKELFFKKAIKAWIRNQMIEQANRQALVVAAAQDTDI